MLFPVLHTYNITLTIVYVNIIVDRMHADNSGMLHITYLLLIGATLTITCTARIKTLFS